MKNGSLMALSAIFGSCLAAIAQNTTPQNPPPPIAPNGQLPPELIKLFDKDGDGKLSDSERVAMQEKIQARRQANQKKPTGKEGESAQSDAVRSAATDAWKGQMEKRQKEIIAKYDKDGDGKLSDEEKKARQEESNARNEAYQKQRLAKFDENGDGILTGKEVEKSRAAHKAAMDKLSKLLDKDNGGTPGDEESTNPK